MAAAKFRFVPDPSGIFAVTHSDEVGKILEQRAQDAVVEIRRLAPRGDDFFDYASGIKANPARVDAMGDLAAEVVVDSPGWHLPEYGTSEVTPTAPIRRGVALANIDFDEF